MTISLRVNSGRRTSSAAARDPAGHIGRGPHRGGIRQQSSCGPSAGQRRGAAAILLNGNVTIERVASDMARLIWNFDRVTSLVDHYGFRDKNTATPEQLEERIREEVDKKVDRSWNESHVIPYVQRYEFEGLLFASVDSFAKLIDVSHESIEGATGHTLAIFPLPRTSTTTARPRRASVSRPSSRGTTSVLTALF